MQDDENLLALQNKLTFLERHVEEQDSEIWRLAQSVEQLTGMVRKQAVVINSLKEQSGGGAPANEKPPHY